MNKLMVSILLLLVANSGLAASIDSDLITRPEGTLAFSADFSVEKAALILRGEQLWNDKHLSRKGKTNCASCHKGNIRTFKKSFLEPYPHFVKMAKKKAGMETISAEGMVQFCMLVPMKATILDWSSEELAALTAYTVEVVQPAYRESKTKN